MNLKKLPQLPIAPYALALVSIALCLGVSSAPQPSNGKTPDTGVRVKKFVAPAYPWIARRAAIQGRVSVRFRLGPDRHMWPQVVGQPHPALRDAVAEAVVQWEFYPLTDGDTVDFLTEFEFVLAGEPRDVAFPTSVVADLPRRVQILTPPPHSWHIHLGQPEKHR